MENRNMMKSIVGLGVAALAVGLVGCNAQSLEELAAVEQAVTCDTMAGTYPVAAALAVALGNEMGEIDAVKNLAVSNGVVVISAAGQALCASRLGCANTLGILAMQDDSLRNYIDQNVFNPTSFREFLKSSFDRQKNHENNLKLNYPTLVPEPELLVLVGTVNNPNACGTHYEFDAFKAGCTGSNCALTKPANEVNRLIFFGLEPNGTSGNPFIAFYEIDGTIAIDPTPALNGGTDSSSSCEAGFMKFDPALAARGDCCSYGGGLGTWQPAPWDLNSLYCAR
jgi:uncharacterized protein (DUF2147 family)